MKVEYRLETYRPTVMVAFAISEQSQSALQLIR